MERAERKLESAPTTTGPVTTRSDPFRAVAAAPIAAAAPVYGWLFMSGALRQLVVARIVDAKLVMGLCTILGIWAGVCVYLVVTKVGHFARTVTPRRTAPWTRSLFRR